MIVSANPAEKRRPPPKRRPSADQVLVQLELVPDCELHFSPETLTRCRAESPKGVRYRGVEGQSRVAEIDAVEHVECGYPDLEPLPIPSQTEALVNSHVERRKGRPGEYVSRPWQSR